MKILTQSQVKAIASKADDAIKLKGLLEAIDGIIIKSSLTLGVNAVEKWKGKDGNPMLPDDVCQTIQDAVDKLLAGDYSGAIMELEPIADKYIDFKKLDDDTEAALFGVVFFLLKTVISYFETNENP